MRCPGRPGFSRDGNRTTGDEVSKKVREHGPLCWVEGEVAWLEVPSSPPPPSAGMHSGASCCHANRHIRLQVETVQTCLRSHGK